jgi:antirestriction protein ArdC
MSQMLEQKTPDQQPSDQQERKNRFAVSREVQAEFVDSVAKTMSELAEKIRAGDKPAPVPQQYCPVTGHAYAGPNMTRLMLESMKQGYTDDRWLTFKQLQHHKFENKDFKPTIRKGEHGVKLLRSEDVFFTVDDKGKWNFLSEEQAKEARQQGDGPRVQRKTLFYPYTVFNASQIDGFPPKEEPAPALSAAERDAILDKFIACAGIPVELGCERAAYSPEDGVVRLPALGQFADKDAYQAMKLRLAFHATSHADRENRELGEGGYTEMLRGETFSMLAGARFGLPMPADGGSWEKQFEGREVREAFEAAADAARMLSVLDQFARDEQPKAKWFPKKEEWPALIAANEEKQPVVAAPAPEPAPTPRRMRA